MSNFPRPIIPETDFWGTIINPGVKLTPSMVGSTTLKSLELLTCPSKTNPVIMFLFLVSAQ